MGNTSGVFSGRRSGCSVRPDSAPQSALLADRMAWISLRGAGDARPLSAIGGAGRAAGSKPSAPKASHWRR